MKKLLIPVFFLALVSCRQAEVTYVDFADFHPTAVTESALCMEDGSLNPEMQVMEPTVDAPDTPDGTPSVHRIASVTMADIAREVLGSYYANSVVQIAGTYTGHDFDGTPLTQSGKIIIPKKGPIRNIILLSHYTVGANYEVPSETFPIEALYAGKGYAIVAADYIGFGVTRQRIHPYLHAESTAQSVVDLLLAAQGYLKHIGRAPEDEAVILFGYSQGGAATLATMRLLEQEYDGQVKLKQVYAGAGPYDLTATYDVSIEQNITGIPCAVPMIVQGINEGEHLGLKMKDFIQPHLLEHFDEWINSKNYTVGQINGFINAKSIDKILTPEGRDHSSPETAKLYKALMRNSVLNFTPKAPLFLFHSTTDNTVPFINSLKAERAFKGKADFRMDFGDYGKHQQGFLKFVSVVGKEL